MLATQRHSIIQSEVERLGTVRVRALAELLGVSEVTIRRDLEQLSGAGKIAKVHGGASRLEAQSTFEPGFLAKRDVRRREKAAIATEAAAMVSPGDAIGVTAGTTTWLLADALRHVDGLTIVTNSLPLVTKLRSAPGTKAEVIVVGGTPTPSDALIGPLAVSALRGIHIDLLFMGVHGMAPTPGYTSPSLIEAETNRAFVASSGGLVVLADSSKWMTYGLGAIVELEAADTLITDSELPTAAVEEIGGAGIELRLVGEIDSGRQGGLVPPVEEGEVEQAPVVTGS